MSNIEITSAETRPIDAPLVIITLSRATISAGDGSVFINDSTK
jgi:hypothetical protein